MTWFRFCGPGGKMPPNTAGKDARRYKFGGSVRMGTKPDGVKSRRLSLTC
jgi:hypothetical protein